MSSYDADAIVLPSAEKATALIQLVAMNSTHFVLLGTSRSKGASRSQTAYEPSSDMVQIQEQSNTLEEVPVQ